MRRVSLFLVVATVLLGAATTAAQAQETPPPNSDSATIGDARASFHATPARDVISGLVFIRNGNVAVLDASPVQGGYGNARFFPFPYFPEQHFCMEDAFHASVGLVADWVATRRDAEPILSSFDIVFYLDGVLQDSVRTPIKTRPFFDNPFTGEIEHFAGEWWTVNIGVFIDPGDLGLGDHTLEATFFLPTPWGEMLILETGPISFYIEDSSQ